MPSHGVTPAVASGVRVASSPPEGWDDFVDENGQASICHLSEWGDIFRDTLRLEPLYLWTEDESGLSGVLPVVRMPRLPWGTTLVSVPFLNYGGPLGSVEARRALVAKVVEVARNAGDRMIELRSRHRLEGSGASSGREKLTVVLELPDDPTILFEEQFGSKLRAQIRRPRKEGMEARSGPNEVGAFYHVFSAHMHRLGTPVIPESWFQAIASSLPHLFRVSVIYHEGQPVAGGFGLRWRDEFEMTWASSLQEFSRLAPNMLLYWDFIEHAIDSGARTFNFGRCSPGGGTHRFKSQWGGVDEALPWLQWPAAATEQNADSGFFRAATSVWKRLPLPIAEALGPRVARRLPTF